MSNLIEKSDSELVSNIGKYIKHQRLSQNMTQEDLAAHSGVKRLTLSKIENGGSFNAITLIKLLRSLDLLEYILERFIVPNVISPSMYIKMQKDSIKRARKSKLDLNKLFNTENKQDTSIKTTLKND